MAIPFLRHLENRLRIINDYSMNALGGSKSYLNRLARRLGYEEKLRNPGEVLMADYERITEGVRQVYDRILGEEGVERQLKSPGVPPGLFFGVLDW